jgi:hypothetical protein
MKIGTDIKNWKDYLERKFSNHLIFTIDDKTNMISSGIYKITAKGSETDCGLVI